MLMHTMTVR